MELGRRRLISLSMVCSFIFLSGSEYAVIFPTAWEFLQSMGVREEYFLGITLAAYSASASISGIVSGHWYDKYPEFIRIQCLICIALKVLGNLQYMLGVGIWNIIIARLICGIGSGAGAALLGYVCRVTSVKERTSKFAICNASRQVGILIAPAFQLFLTLIDFQIGPLRVDRLNAAGLFMALMWFIFVLAFWAVFEDVSIEWKNLTDQSESDRFEDRPLSVSLANPSNTAMLSICDSVNSGPPESFILPKWRDEFFRDTMIALMGAIFTIYFDQIVIETLIPYYMKDYFNYGDVPVSFMYMASGAECLIMLALLIFASKLVNDWVLHLVGLLLAAAGYLMMLYLVPQFTPGDSSKITQFTIAFLIIGAGYHMTAVSNSSLVSKSLSTETQGLGQGIRRLMSYLGLVIGPLWAGAAARKPVLLMGVALALTVIHLLIYLDALPKLMRIEKAARSLESDDAEEETPLIDRNRSQPELDDWSSI